jgi:hypothetical protein
MSQPQRGVPSHSLGPPVSGQDPEVTTTLSGGVCLGNSPDNIYLGKCFTLYNLQLFWVGRELKIKGSWLIYSQSLLINE